MLSTEECRHILGLPQLSDKEVEEIRETLYAFAHTFIDKYVDDRQSNCAAPSGSRIERSRKPRK